MDKLNYTDEDLLKWAKAVADDGTLKARQEIAKKIWEDGYRTAELEITYKETSV